MSPGQRRAIKAVETKAAHLRGETDSGARHGFRPQLCPSSPCHLGQSLLTALLPYVKCDNDAHVLRLPGELNKVSKATRTVLDPGEAFDRWLPQSSSSGLCDLQPKGPSTKTEGGFLAGSEGRRGTDQEAGARDGKALLVEVGAAEEQEHVGLVLLPVLSKDLGELPQLCQV